MLMHKKERRMTESNEVFREIFINHYIALGGPGSTRRIIEFADSASGGREARKKRIILVRSSH